MMLASRGALTPGIKVDAGTSSRSPAIARAKPPRVAWMGLGANAVEEYYALGARFAKWRAVLTIDDRERVAERVGVRRRTQTRWRGTRALCQSRWFGAHRGARDSHGRRARCRQSCRAVTAQRARRGVCGAAFARRAVGRDDFEAKHGDARGGARRRARTLDGLDVARGD